ncbi:MAG: Pentapeptide repeat (9 copies) [Gammaproteobacteria bacterium]|jgi:hypothetical protein|nr:Pentapeptide repeat (9 copies) [Gammaproteobacteria bacterium]
MLTLQDLLHLNFADVHPKKLTEIFKDQCVEGKLIIENVDFSLFGTLLQNVDFSNCVLRNCKFAHQKLLNCNFENCVQENCVFDGVIDKFQKQEVMARLCDFFIKKDFQYNLDLKELNQRWLHYMQATHPDKIADPQYFNELAKKSPSTEAIYYSEGFCHFNLPRAKADVGWKLHLSVSPDQLAMAHQYIISILLKYNVAFKVVDHSVETAEKHYTIYIEVGAPQALSNAEVRQLIIEISDSLAANSIKPGLINKSSARTLSPYFSLRNDKVIELVPSTHRVRVENKNLWRINVAYISAVDADLSFNPSFAFNPYEDILHPEQPIPREPWDVCALYNERIFDVAIATLVSYSIEGYLLSNLAVNLPATIDEDEHHSPPELTAALLCLRAFKPLPAHLLRKEAQAIPHIRERLSMLAIMYARDNDQRIRMKYDQLLKLYPYPDTFRMFLEFLQSKIREQEALKSERSLDKDENLYQDLLPTPVILTKNEIKWAEHQHRMIEAELSGKADRCACWIEHYGSADPYLQLKILGTLKQFWCERYEDFALLKVKENDPAAIIHAVQQLGSKNKELEPKELFPSALRLIEQQHSLSLLTIEALIRGSHESAQLARFVISLEQYAEQGNDYAKLALGLMAIANKYTPPHSCSLGFLGWMKCYQIDGLAQLLSMEKAETYLQAASASANPVISSFSQYLLCLMPELSFESQCEHAPDEYAPGEYTPGRASPG